MTLIGRGADHVIGADADAGLAGVGLGAGVAVVARVAVGLIGLEQAPAGAGARDVALVERGADDRVAAGANARLASVGLGAGVAVAAGVAVVLDGLEHCRWRDCRCPTTWHWSSAAQTTGLPAGADARLASVGLGASAPVVAADAVAFGRVGAQAARRIASSCDMALVEGVASDGHVRAGSVPEQSIDRASIAVVATTVERVDLGIGIAGGIGRAVHVDTSTLSSASEPPVVGCIGAGVGYVGARVGRVDNRRNVGLASPPSLLVTSAVKNRCPRERSHVAHIARGLDLIAGAASVAGLRPPAPSDL